MTNKIKLIVLDVDGVLTDGKLYIGSDRVEYKPFHTQDGMGISLAHYTGIKTAIITGRKSEAVSKRAEELKVGYVYQGIHDKFPVLEGIMKDMDITLQEVCYMGDDINDLPIMQRVGLAVAPDNAVSIVKEYAHQITKLRGGEGAVREMIDGILFIEHNYSTLITDYLQGKVVIVQ
ncbi:HAD-IIIA family hydrolase [Rossellomorea marisflavi]|uniref:HAD-IIIA family hydrolase n=1 Tax=Rossellomorea marisflavi TaxID=189381 RepID=A0A5D4RMM2_9BACI|nr:HAD-IIIA family hydrolase [Rossellomorea marisflavi]TYS52497.1 HAD-IIIA family hydrolase [Rossellomorea marisflavi]